MPEGRSIECEDIEDILLEVMSTEFCTLLEDGSEREVAKSLWTLFQESIKGRTALLDSLRQRAARSPITLPSRTESTTDDEEGQGDGAGMVLD